MTDPKQIGVEGGHDDKAINTISIAQGRRFVIHGEDGPSAITEFAQAAQPTQPDCRTCANYSLTVEFENAHTAHGCDHGGCTNGDKYEAAPAVVLWRTEP